MTGQNLSATYTSCAGYVQRSGQDITPSFLMDAWKVLCICYDVLQVEGATRVDLLQIASLTLHVRVQHVAGGTAYKGSLLTGHNPYNLPQVGRPHGSASKPATRPINTGVSAAMLQRMCRACAAGRKPLQLAPHIAS
jgi:hypothetical protein